VTAHPTLTQPGRQRPSGKKGRRPVTRAPHQPRYPSEAQYPTEVMAEVRRRPAGVPRQLTVRASYLLHGFIASGGVVLAVGFTFAAADAAGWRASIRWVAAAGFAVLALVALRAVLSGPLLVADSTGVRLRIGDDWIGARWAEIDVVSVLPRRHLLGDGRIAVHLEDPAPVLAAMSSTVRRQTDANRRLTGSSLAVPFGLALRASGTADTDVAEVLRQLADGRCAVTVQP
jgi:hypothetical protein